MHPAACRIVPDLKKKGIRIKVIEAGHLQVYRGPAFTYSPEIKVSYRAKI
jgi:hypothetical protein